MENLYPTIPSAPPVEIHSTNYRIQHISELRQILENEVKKRESLARKYATASGIVSKLDIALITVGVGAGATGLILIAAPPIAIGLEALAGVCGVGGIACTFIRGRFNTKRSKHSEVATIARTKLNSIADLIDHALQDGVITSDEFNLVVAEYKKFNQLVEKKKRNSRKR